jgi:hypothetical protein
MMIQQPHPQIARMVRAANDNAGGRTVIFSWDAPEEPCIAEIEVFGSFLADLEAANDNEPLMAFA